jgi:hypothetical protein
MTAPVLIDYPTFLANVQENDVRALALLAGGNTIKTMSSTEGDTYEAIGVRLFNAGLVTRFRRSMEVQTSDVWHVFDGIVHPAALNYIAQCAMERVKLSRAVIPA